MIRPQLRKYQIEALDKMVKSKVFLEYDDMGIGKTITTLAAIEELNALPCLIIVPKFGLMVWEGEIAQWLNMPAVIYSGKPKERAAQWKEFITGGYKFLITNYAMLPEVASKSGITEKRTDKPTGTFKWGAIIWDEIHMGGLFNYKNLAYKISDKLAHVIPVRFCLTGTPFRQGVIDLYGPLHLMNPLFFKNYWSFVGRYCIKINNGFGVNYERNPADIDGFRKMLGNYMIRRLKDEVATELPGKWRQSLFTTMDAEQQKVYDQLTEELIAEIENSGDLLITPNQMTLQMRQRQLLACPQVLGLKTRGAGLDLILEHSHTSLDDGKPIVIFTPFKKAVPYIEEALRDEYTGISIYKITGGLSAQEFGYQWQTFQNSVSPQRVLICVIKSGASFQATAAATAYFLGYEWDFNLNEQGEDRLYRIGQKAFVNIYYAMHKGTVDEAVAARLNEKKNASDWVVGTERQYLAKLRELHGKK